jgi:2-methylcitrate dehydratase PrpD
MSVGSSNPTEVLAAHVTGLNLAALPPDVVAFTKMLFADTVGVLLAASRHGPVRKGIDALSLSTGPATIIGHPERASVETAAFINGIGGHDIELDDSHSPSRTHAASVIVPSALAAAEAGAQVSGATLLEGIICGYDTQVRISKAMGVQNQFERGFHPTSVCGTFGSAAAAGHVLGLGQDELVSALALAGSQSAGLLTFEDDYSHMTKSFQTGVAARNGLYAVLLARGGFKGTPDVLTGENDALRPFGGPHPTVAELGDALGVRYDVCETSIKRHACCGQTHSSIDALLDIIAAHGLSASDIASIDVAIATGAVSMVNANALWTHNIQYILALTAMVGRVGVEHFGPDWTSRQDIADLAARVTLKGSDELQTHFPRQKGSIVTVRTTDTEFTLRCPAPKGNPNWPLSQAEIHHKFNALAGVVLAPARTDELWQLCMDIDREDDLRRLFDLLGGHER